MSTLLALAAGGLTVTSIVVVTQASAVPAGSGTSCADVHVITARASTERPGEGITGSLVTRIVNTSDQTVSRASVDYPATLTNYQRSSSQGVTALTAQLTDQVQECPDQKIVLTGYSQGAHVVLDVLGGGGGGVLGGRTAPIDASIADRVAAVVTFGDPRHVVDQAFDLAPRPATAASPGRRPNCGPSPVSPTGSRPTATPATRSAPAARTPRCTSPT